LIDLHCHLLPGIDDGPATVEEAADLAVASFASGVRVAVATPHLDPRYDPSVDEVESAREALASALAERECPLEVLTGAEVAHTRARDMSLDELKERTLGDGNCLLIESPFNDGASDLEMLVHDLSISGFKVLLAHPERSGFFVSDPSRLDAMVERGAVCSFTAASFNGQFGRTVRKKSLELAARGYVHNISSDTHNLSSRKPGLDVEAGIPGLGTQEERDTLAASLIAPTQA
jgi:protein-tyrosine phosphatase